MHHQIGDWMSTGSCALLSPAVSGIVNDLQQLHDSPSTALNPSRLPGGFGCGDGVVGGRQGMLMRIAEHFRATAVPSQEAGREAALPLLPLNAEELKWVAHSRHRPDELEALRRLADPGFVTANISRSPLDSMRDAAVGAMNLLRDERGSSQPVQDSQCDAIQDTDWASSV